MQSQCTKNAFLYHCAHTLDMLEMKYKSSLFIIWALAYHGILNIGPVTNSYQQIQTLSVWLAFTALNIWVHRHIICHQSLKSIWLKLLQQVITDRQTDSVYTTQYSWQMTQIRVMLQLLQQDVKSWINESNICTESIQKIA